MGCRILAVSAGCLRYDLPMPVAPLGAWTPHRMVNSATIPGTGNQSRSRLLPAGTSVGTCPVPSQWIHGGSNSESPKVANMQTRPRGSSRSYLRYDSVIFFQTGHPGFTGETLGRFSFRTPSGARARLATASVWTWSPRLPPTTLGYVPTPLGLGSRR